MNITVNGKSEEIEEKSTILSLFDQKRINRSHVVVELNRKVIKRDEFSRIKLNENDSIEILQLVGGG